MTDIDPTEEPNIDEIDVDFEPLTSAELMENLDTLIEATPETLIDLGVPLELVWSATIALIAAKYDWTIDEASENMANLLESLEGGDE